MDDTLRESLSRPDSSIVWTPSPELLESCAMTRFMQLLNQRGLSSCASFAELHNWSLRQPEQFWPQAMTFLEVIGDGNLAPFVAPESGPTPLARRWFPDFSLNFAENLLHGDSQQPAIISWTEGVSKRRISRGELRSDVNRLASHLAKYGLTENERAFAYLPNIPEAISCMLATALIGATWSSCGTDYQVEGLQARIERVQPVVLFAALSYQWRGAEQSLIQVIDHVVSHTPSIRHVVFIDYLKQCQQPPVLSRSEVTTSLYSSVRVTPGGTSQIRRFSFSHPLYIMFSSGTTGKPKGIVHSAGGTLLEHKKELILHSDIRPGDRVFYQTSTSWMMWNWLVSALACNATIVLYDGDPMLHDGMVLWDLASSEHVTHFGTSASYIGELQRRSIIPRAHVDLSHVRAIFSTGSPLYPHAFDFIAESIKPLWLQSISGGTDIIGCFGLGCPRMPVYRGEVQCKSLGYDVRVLDAAGASIIGKQGELVCAAPAPSMPVCFLDDPDGSAYRAAYFNEFPTMWRHGDFVEETPHGGLIFRGRSDATLKPGGVRVATADLYQALSRVQEVQAALAVGYTANPQANEKIVLFVVLPAGTVLTADLQATIRTELKRSNSFYVPALIIQAPELPRTTNNKLSELSVKRILHGLDAGNSSALANPACLDFFRTSALPLVHAALGGTGR
jgi:acetoacetyl-CoA synthetase